MKSKLWICLIVIMAGLGIWIQTASSAYLTYAELRPQLKYRLALSSPDFEDADLNLCLDMAGMAILNHGLALSTEIATSFGVLDSGQQYIWLGVDPTPPINVLFVSSVSKLRASYLPADPDLTTEISLLEVDLKDIGHQELDTDVPASYYCQYHDHDTAWLYIYPAPIEATQLYIEYYRSMPDNLGDYFVFNPIYEEILLDYAEMIAWIRMGNWRAVASAYNSYQTGIAILREEVINSQPDITVEYKTIKK